MIALYLFLPTFLVLYVVLSLILPRIPVNKKSSEAQQQHQLYARTNGIHMDFVLPVALLPTLVHQQLQPAPNARYVGIGWGDRGFYLDTPTWAELRPSVALNAMFIPSPTVMHVTDYQLLDEEWLVFGLDDHQLKQLIDYIYATFQTDAAGQVTELVGKGYTEDDRFYEANGKYMFYKTCNTWVNIGLKRSGVKTAVWTSTDKGVSRYLCSVAHAATNQPSTPDLVGMSQRNA